MFHGNDGIDHEEEEESAISLTDIFKRSQVPLFKRLLNHALCPQVGFDDLTLENDEHQYQMHRMKCCHLKCDQCGPSKKLNLEDPDFFNNQDEIPIWLYEDCPRPGNTTQLELVLKTMTVSEVLTQLFIPQLLGYLPHYFSIRFLHRGFFIKIRTFKRNELLKAMDFSTAVPLEASKLLCGSTKRYGALAI